MTKYNGIRILVASIPNPRILRSTKQHPLFPEFRPMAFADAVERPAPSGRCAAGGG